MVNKQEVVTVLRRGGVYSLDSKEHFASEFYTDRAGVNSYLWDCMYYILKNEGLFEGTSFDELYDTVEKITVGLENNDLTRGVYIQITDEGIYFIDRDLIDTGLLSVIDLYKEYGAGI